MIPAQLSAEVEELRAEQHEIDLHDDPGGPVVIIKDYPVLPGFTASTTDLLLRFPPSYPNGKPDMFWTTPALLLKGGAVPKNAEAIETIVGRQWRRFSWHIPGSAYVPGVREPSLRAGRMTRDHLEVGGGRAVNSGRRATGLPTTRRASLRRPGWGARRPRVPPGPRT